jgi:hypothetical protein
MPVLLPELAPAMGTGDLDVVGFTLEFDEPVGPLIGLEANAVRFLQSREFGKHVCVVQKLKPRSIEVVG